MAIKVLIVDDVIETCDNITKLLSFDRDIEVIGTAHNGEQALAFIAKNTPDIVLMDINMPIMDGVEATERISVSHPGISIIMITVQSELEYIKRAMVAGARDYIVKPFTSDQLISSIKKIHRLDTRKNNRPSARSSSKPKVIAVFSPKGGIGTTTIAVNLAVSMHQLTDKRVALLDLDLQASDVGVMLDLKLTRSIVNIVQNIGYLDQDMLTDCLCRHQSGIDVLLAPPEPQYADLIKVEYVEKIIAIMKKCYDYIIIDTSSVLDAFNINTLKLSDEILVVMGLEITTIRRIKKALEILSEFGIAGNIRYVLNRSSDEIGLNRKDVEKHLDIKIDNHIISNGQVTVNALNRGIPFVINSHAAKISDDIKKLALNCAREEPAGSKRRLFAVKS
jgi:pilus assembly protein CpaE